MVTTAIGWWLALAWTSAATAPEPSTAPPADPASDPLAAVDVDAEDPTATADTDPAAPPPADTIRAASDREGAATDDAAPASTTTPTTTPTDATAAIAPPVRRRWIAPGAWVPNAWPTAQVCALDVERAPWCFIARTDVFAGARAGTIGGAKASEFRLDRAEVGVGMLWRPTRALETGAVVGMEAVRSAGPQSLTGIDGDSLVVRLLDAYGQAAAHLGPIDLGARVGLVPERWLEQVEKGYDTRGLEPLGSDRTRMFDRSDLGVTLTASGWDSRVDVDVSIVNGEGRAQRERNAGKNTTAILTVRPVLRQHPRGPIVLAVHGGFRDGSLGIASIADRRGAAAVTFASPWVYAGFEYVHALGIGGHGRLRANAMSAWVSGRILPRWLGATAKLDRNQQDLARAGSVVTAVTIAAFSDVFEHIDRNRRRVRLYAGYALEHYGDGAAPLPGVAQAAIAHRFLFQLELRGLARITPKEARP